MARDSKGRFAADVEIRVKDSATAWLRRITNNFELIRGAAKKASKAFDVAANMRHAADGVTDFSTKLGSAVQKPIKRFMDFQEVMSSVKASTFDLTEAMDPKQTEAMNGAMADLNKTARDLGASTKFSATQVAEGMDILAKNFGGSDIEKAQAVAAAMPGILDAAAAAKESIATTSDISSSAMNQFGLAAKDMGMIGDILVKTANSSATGLTDLGEALKYSGVTAKAAGLDLGTTVAMLGALGNAGKKGSQAGTGLSSVLGNMQSAMKKQKGALAALGIDIKDKNGNLRPVVELLAEIDKAADKKFGKGKGGVKRDRWMQALVGMGSDKEVLAILTKQAGSGELQKLVAANEKSRGASKAVAAAMNDNAAGAAKNLDSALEELQLTIGERVIPEVTDLFKWANETVNSFAAWSKEHPALVKGAMALAGGLVLIGLVVGPVIKGVSAIVTVYGGLKVALASAKTAFIALRAAALANPVTAIITGIATAALLIYEYWDPISNFFSGLWSSITESFNAALEWIIGKLNWVSGKIEEAQLSMMSEEMAALAVKQKEQDAAAAARQVFANSEDAYSVHSKASVAPAPAGDALGALRDVRDIVGSWRANAANALPAGPPALPQDAGAGGKFDGELKISIDSEGNVAKTELKQRGEQDSGFRVRMNRGRQAA